MADSPTRTYFFIHVMKTAGMTLNRQIDANFAPDEIFPGPDDETGADYWVVDRLRKATAERRDQVKVWRGHFPFFVTELVPEATTMTLLREPVARTISLLEQRRDLENRDEPIEAMYEDATMFGREIHNHQTKIFSLTAADNPKTYLKIMSLDRSRLGAAKAALERVDLLGCQERFDEFVQALEHRFGWRTDNRQRVNVGPRITSEASSSFRRRVADDNALDVELYEYARELIA